MPLRDLTKPPFSEYVLIALLLLGFVASYVFGNDRALYAAAGLAALPALAAAARDLYKRKISIDVFNTFALVVAFVLTDARSAGFICLMLASARLLDHFTTDRADRSMRALLALKPTAAEIEHDGVIQKISADDVKVGDLVVVSEGGRAPADGTVVFGATHVDESSLTGESAPVFKTVGDPIFSGTVVVSGAFKIRAEHVGKNSTVSRLVELAAAAAAHKSGPEKLADKFAGIFLPIVVALGAVVFIVTRNATMTAALFLVACADDMSVAVPLAVTAALGAAARRGVIIKGGERLAKVSTVRILVLDKTGTLTYGHLNVSECEIVPGRDEQSFLRQVGAAEKFSEHPAGRAVFRYVSAKIKDVPDPSGYETVAGAGVIATVDREDILVGTREFLSERKVKNLPAKDAVKFGIWAAAGGAYIGRFCVADTPRPEARQALARMKRLGVARVIMFTGDRPEEAARVALALGIDEYHSLMKPEDKVRELEKLLPEGPVMMVGDGVNDAAVLSRADVGVAMGSGSAAAAEAADAVILVDDLGRLPDLVTLARRAIGVIGSDVWIWAVSNLVGFALVLSGLAGPAGAAFYNFATDFLPVINSTRMFRIKK